MDNKLFQKFVIGFILTAILAIVVVFLNQPRVDMIVNGNSDNQKPIEETTVLLLGKVSEGEGGQWHNAPDLADTIIAAQYKPQNQTLNLISLPRDLYVNFDGESLKLTEVIRRDKIARLLQFLPEISGIKTEQFIIFDLTLVKKIVDDLGGVDIDLPAPAVDMATGYTMEAGERHLNGEDAVWLIRNRFAPEGDFFREKNQHLVIEAVSRKYLALDHLSKIKFFFGLTPVISRLETNTQISELFSLSEKVNDIKFKSVVLDFSTGLLQTATTTIETAAGEKVEQSILVPQLGQNNYEDVKTYIRQRIGGEL